MLHVISAINPVDSVSGNLGNVIFPIETNLDYLRKHLSNQPELLDVVNSIQQSLETLKEIKQMIEQNE